MQSNRLINADAAPAPVQGRRVNRHGGLGVHIEARWQNEEERDLPAYLRHLRQGLSG